MALYPGTGLIGPPGLDALLPLQHPARTFWAVSVCHTHLLMYSALRSFPQVLHLKQPRCQCLSKATRAWPFLISKPQPPQPEIENKQTPSLWAQGPPTARPSNPTSGTQPLRILGPTESPGTALEERDRHGGVLKGPCPTVPGSSCTARGKA